MIDNESVKIYFFKKNGKSGKNIKEGVNLIVKNSRESLCDVYLVI